MSLGVGQSQNVGFRDFCHILTLWPPWCHSDSASFLLYFTLLSLKAPVFQKHIIYLVVLYSRAGLSYPIADGHRTMLKLLHFYILVCVKSTDGLRVIEEAILGQDHIISCPRQNNSIYVELSGKRTCTCDFSVEHGCPCKLQRIESLVQNDRVKFIIKSISYHDDGSWDCKDGSVFTKHYKLRVISEYIFA